MTSTAEPGEQGGELMAVDPTGSDGGARFELILPSAGHA